MLVRLNDGPQGRGYRTDALRNSGYDFGEPVAGALAAGETVAPEFGPAEAAGEVWAGVVAGDGPGEECVPAGAGEVCGAACVFINSRRKALLAMLWCA